MSYKTLDDGYLTIKQKIGEGTYCKVNKAECKVFRDIMNKEINEFEKVEGVQEMAVKVFKRQNLRK